MGTYYTGFGSDDGYDAMKDANLEFGFDRNDSRGLRSAYKRGWLRKVIEEDKEENKEGEFNQKSND